jgi:sterol desaturase/sphingolipid hydroxylase (fatty acid hydroxylase superfamily)
MFDWNEITTTRPWLYPLAAVFELLLGVKRLELTWLAILLAIVVLVINLDRIIETRSSAARQTPRPRAILQDLILLFVQLAISKLVPLVLVAFAWRQYAPGLAGAIRSTLGIDWMLVDPSPILVTLLLAGVALTQDLSGYLVHRLQHRVDWLWELHKFHHSAESLSVFTTFREHPLLAFMNRLTIGLASTPLAVAALVICPQILEGSVQAGGLVSFLLLKPTFLLHHFHRPISFGFLEGWVVTPASHAVHHSRDPAHHDKNFGVALSLWDRLFSTHHDASAEELARLRFGIDETRHVAGRVLPLSYLYVSLTLNAWRLLMARLPRALRARSI